MQRPIATEAVPALSPYVCMCRDSPMVAIPCPNHPIPDSLYFAHNISLFHDQRHGADTRFDMVRWQYPKASNFWYLYLIKHSGHIDSYTPLPLFDLALADIRAESSTRFEGEGEGGGKAKTASPRRKQQLAHQSLSKTHSYTILPSVEIPSDRTTASRSFASPASASMPNMNSYNDATAAAAWAMDGMDLFGTGGLTFGRAMPSFVNTDTALATETTETTEVQSPAMSRESVTFHSRGPKFNIEQFRKNRKHGACEEHRKSKKACTCHDRRSTSEQD